MSCRKLLGMLQSMMAESATISRRGSGSKYLQR